VPQKLLTLPQSGIRITPADSYRLSPATADKRLAALLEEWPLPEGKQFGTYLIPHNSRFSDIARVVECTVFERFFGNTAECMAEAYAPYEEHSLFLLAIDQLQRRPAGTIRIILPSGKGLKSLNDISGAPLHISAEMIEQQHGITNARRCWDIGTLAVHKEYRAANSDHMVSLMLYGHLFALLRRRCIQHMVTILDRHAYAQLVEVLGAPIIPLAGSEPFSYLGSDSSRACYAAVATATGLMEAHLASLPPEVQSLLKPYVARFLYCEDMSELVEVHEDVERTGRVQIARLMG
jgi:hypothetical protein